MGECGILIVNPGICWGSIAYLLLALVSAGVYGIPITNHDICWGSVVYLLLNMVSGGGVLYIYC